MTLEVILCYLNIQLHIVMSINKCGNSYLKWTLFFSLNKLNSIVGSYHFFNCINYYILPFGTVQWAWGKLIIAVCFKSVLHPGLTISSHLLTEMKELEWSYGLIIADAGEGADHVWSLSTVIICSMTQMMYFHHSSS